VCSSHLTKLTTVVVGASLIGLTNAECPNACSSHGICGVFDKCECYRNWMSNDCSERVCQFGLAHVDTPKGDLDSSSGVLTGPGINIIKNDEVYPYGTTEQFPNMVDSNGVVLENTAHYYMECSNKGICDREAGVCECFPGYEGSSCQRASCPSNNDGVCSGHGTCESIKELSALDSNNIYELWDKKITLGCDCDPGYYGADCSLRECKYGADPLYTDDSKATQRVANWTYGFHTISGYAGDITGNYSLVFYDVFGEDWRTDAIQFDDDCPEIIARLEGIPNDVIPYNSVLCLKQENDFLTQVGSHGVRHPILTPPANYRYHKIITLVFPQNPGILKQLEVDINLDGPRPTLVTDEITPSTLQSFVYADGFHGEFVDIVPDLCEDVEATITWVNNGVHYLDGLTARETIALKRCLGSSDNDNTLAAEVFNWDYGTIENPHLIKLVDASYEPKSRICNSTDTYFAPTGDTDWCDYYSPAGFYVPLIFKNGKFQVWNDIQSQFYHASNPFRIFTTTGHLQRVNDVGDFYVTEAFGTVINYPHRLTLKDILDCETNPNPPDGFSCLNKGDRIMFLNLDDDADSSWNAAFHNIYTVQKVGRSLTSDYERNQQIVLDMGINFGHKTDLRVYKFTPGNTVSWAAECSDRGVCDSSSGICKCFTGYTKDDCSVQSTLAK